MIGGLGKPVGCNCIYILPNGKLPKIAKKKRLLTKTGCFLNYNKVCLPFTCISSTSKGLIFFVCLASLYIYNTVYLKNNTCKI